MPLWKIRSRPAGFWSGIWVIDVSFQWDAYDDAALEFLESHQGIAWKIARSFTHSDADCQDVVQEINLSLWKVWDQIPKGVKPSTYVYRVALNRAITWQRKGIPAACRTQARFNGLCNVRRAVAPQRFYSSIG